MASRFTASVEAWTAKTVRQLDAGGKKVCAEILRRVVERTPIGNPEWPKHSGLAKGNWDVSQVAPNYSYDLTLLDEDGSSTILRGQQVIDSIRFDQDYHVIIANHVPYIVRLEFGWSASKAPAGMVRITLEEFARIVTEVFTLGGGAPIR